MTTIRKLKSPGSVVAALVLCLSTYTASALAGRDYKAPRNSHGQPDLQGLWDFRNLTPLERPKAMGDKATFTPEELASFKQKAIGLRSLFHNPARSCCRALRHRLPPAGR